MDPMKLVYVSAVRVARAKRMDWRDLVGAAWEGLAKAHETYDASKGASFLTYATWKIRGALTDYLRTLEPAGHRRSTGRKSPSPRRKVYSLELCIADRDKPISDTVGREDGDAYRDAFVCASEVLCGRELELVRLRLDGCNDKEIAAHMGISESRVQQLRMKIGAKAIEHGIISAPRSEKRRRNFQARNGAEGHGRPVFKHEVLA